MSEKQQTLKWGDVVRVHGVNLSKKNPSKGLILSKGYFCYYVDLLTRMSITKSIMNSPMSIFTVSPYFNSCRGQILTYMTSFSTRISRNFLSYCRR